MVLSTVLCASKQQCAKFKSTILLNYLQWATSVVCTCRIDSPRAPTNHRTGTSPSLAARHEQLRSSHVDR